LGLGPNPPGKNKEDKKEKEKIEKNNHRKKSGTASKGWDPRFY